MNLSESEGLQDNKIDPSMFELFSIELETQCTLLSHGLIDLEKNSEDLSLIESLMRAAHSIKGAARVVNLNHIGQLAHAMEDYFVSLQKLSKVIDSDKVDQLLQCVDLLKEFSQVSYEKIHSLIEEKRSLVESLIKQLSHSENLILKSTDIKSLKVKKLKDEEISFNPASLAKNVIKVGNVPLKSFQSSFKGERVLRVSAKNLNRLMGLAGESLVESRWLYPFEEELLKLKKIHGRLEFSFELLRGALRETKVNEKIEFHLNHIHKDLDAAKCLLVEKFNDLDNFIRRHASLSNRLYQEVVDSRMRPFGDGVEGFPRLVRDLSHQLGKKVHLEIEGINTSIDRDILEKLESPLSHLIRNAIDHGIESPNERIAKGKKAEGTIRLEARHKGGMLAITVSDDGRGIDPELLKKKIIENRLADEQMVNRLSHSELFDFLYLPGFSTSKTVSDISGRGVGLNVVLTMVQEVGGSVRITSTLGKGSSFFLILPLTLSVIRALIVKIAGEPYGFPLARIDRVFVINPAEIQRKEKELFFLYEEQSIRLVEAWKILELDDSKEVSNSISLVIVHHNEKKFGLIVDSLIGEKELVVQELDPRLEKIPDIIAGSLMEDGSPLLMIDVEDMIRSIESYFSSIINGKEDEMTLPVDAKRVLLVDDSSTVREIGSRLLKEWGYIVDSVPDGVEAWNAIRIGRYNLMITDVDMPRLNGIELIKKIRIHSVFTTLPIIIVSYKQSEEYRKMGFEAGANAFLNKSSFHDEQLFQVIQQLLNE
ncbi:MAG: hybrid sensor histidine kinase/response regulator [Parachlamydiaceae bacterium]|nr:hybrid sensor histidine kinase/response regulator [Parachlamydiaceae bacterium]